MIAPSSNYSFAATKSASQSFWNFDYFIWFNKKNRMFFSFSLQNENIPSTVIIWLFRGLCKLALATSRLVVPPTPSHAFFHGMIQRSAILRRGQSPSDDYKHLQFFLFLYWLAAPSVKYNNFFICGCSSFRWLVKICWKQ